MKYAAILMIIFCILLFSAGKASVIELKNGEKIKCSIVSEENGVLTVVSETFGEMKINRSDIELITEFNTNTGYRYDDPNHNSLLFMPSAETNPAGTKYISSYELLYMNTGLAATDNFHVSLGFLFPIVPEMLTEGPISLGLKWRVHSKPYDRNFSIMSSFTTIGAGDASMITYGMAFNKYLSPETTFDLYLGGLSSEGDTIVSFGLGATHRMSESSKFIVEYVNGGVFDDIDTDGVFIFGLRFFGEKFSGDLAGVKFLDISSDGDAWFIIPLVSLTYHF